MTCSNANIPQNEQNVNDGTECYASATFYDVDGNLYTPSSLSYRIDDITNNVAVVPPTVLSPSTSVRVTITSAQNTMNVASRLRERRQVMFIVGVPGGTTRYDDTTYVLIRKVGTP
jgi:hypothetical protein